MNDAEEQARQQHADFLERDNAIKAAAADAPQDVVVAQEGLSLSETSLSIGVGATADLTPYALPEGAQFAGDVAFTSSDEGVATVSDTGTVAGVSVGDATVTVACGDFNAECSVNVA